MDRLSRPAIILLADDDLDDQEITRRALSSGKIANKLYIVEDGVEAINFLKNQEKYSDPMVAPKPDLILLDLNMPRKDGFHVLKEIKADLTICTIPVVILTTSSEQEDIVKTYNLGCNSFISKPIDPKDFYDRIRELERYWFEIVILPRS